MRLLKLLIKILFLLVNTSTLGSIPKGAYVIMLNYMP
jgi:hypothetical protein